MSIFRKKKSKEDVYDEGKKTNAAQYNIHIYEGLGKTPRKIKTFVAERWVDDDDKIPYLRYQDPRNKGDIWLEVFPEKVKDFVNKDKQTLQKELKELEKKLEDEKNKDEPEVNFKDIQYEIMKIHAQLRTFNFSPDASYVSLDENNKPEFFYKREGSTYHPFKWDMDTSTIYTPSDNKKKSSTIALRNKENKYNTTPLSYKVLSMIFLAITMIAALGFGYLSYKSVNQYSDSEIQAAKEQCLQNYAGVVSQTEKQASTINKILSDFEGKLEVTPEVDNERKEQDFNE